MRVGPALPGKGRGTLSAASEGPFQIGRECHLRVKSGVFRERVLGVAKDTIWVSLSTDIDMPDGTPVELEFHEPEGHLNYHTRVVIPPGHGREGMVLQRSAGSNQVRHRQSWRVPANFAGMVRPLDEERAHEARVIDLSAEGALIETPAELPIASRIAFTFALPEGPPHTVTAHVIHDDVREGGVAFRFGLRFAELPAEVRRSLTTFLWGRIKDLYPEELRAAYAMTRRRRPQPVVPSN